MSSVEEQLAGLMAKFEANLDDETLEIGKQVAKECAAEIRRTSPRNRPEYYKHWTYKALRGAGKSITYVVYNRKYPGLTHLLEKGHTTIKGGTTKAIPHIGPAEQKYNQIYLERMEGAVKDAGND